jgi:CHAT domain-containing protein
MGLFKKFYLQQSTTMKIIIILLISLCHWLPLQGQNDTSLKACRLNAQIATEAENYKEALANWQKLHLAVSSEDSINYYAANIANCYQKLNLSDTALIWAEQAKKSDYIPAKQFAYLVSAQIWVSKTNYDKAKEVLDSLEILLKKNTNTELQLSCWYEKVSLLIRQNNLAAADTLNKKGLVLSENKFGRIHQSRIVFLANAGIIARRTNANKEAMAYFNQALLLANQLNIQSSGVLARLQINIGNLYLDESEYEKALWHYEKSLSISEKLYGKQHNLVGMAHRGMAGAYRQQGKFRQSFFHLNEAYLIFKNIGGELNANVANVYMGMGINYIQTQKYITALNSLEKALAIMRSIYEPNHTELAIVYGNMATTYGYLKNTKLSGLFYQKALDIYLQKSGKYAPRVIVTYTGLADMYLENNNVEEAYRYIKLAFCSLFKNDSLNIEKIIFSSSAVAQQVYDFDNDEYPNAVTLYLNYLLKQYERNPNINYLHKGKELTTAGLNYIKHREEEFSDIKDKISFAAKLIDLLEILAKINVKLYEVEQKKEHLGTILTIIEQNKAIALLENNQKQNLFANKEVPQELKNKENSLRENIKKVETDLQTAQLNNEVETIQKLRLKWESFHQEYGKLKQQIKSDYNSYYQNFYGHKVVKLSELQQSLGKEQWIFEYLEGKETLVAMIIGNKKVAVRLIDKKNYNISLSAIYNQLNGISIHDQNNTEMISAFAKDGGLLYKEFLQWGFESLGARPQSLIIVPDGKLSSVPFEILMSREPTVTEMRWDSLPYLIKSYPISYAYSSSFWHKKNSTASQKRSSKQMLALAAAYDVKSPSYREDYLKDIRKNLSPLSGVEQEIKELKAGKWSGFFAYGEKCGEKIFKSQSEGYQIIHLAMHGLADKQQPILSSLAFTETQDSLEDNFLHVYEIMNMNFSADLVVLSACETGSGDFQQGTGVVSAGYAFAYAGVPAVVTSLWAVNDQTTATIMKFFYENLSLNMRKDESMRQAKLSYLKKASKLSAHPNLWAAFIVTGNCSPIGYIGGFKWGVWGYLFVLIIVVMSLYAVWVFIHYARLRWVGK